MNAADVAALVESQLADYNLDPIDCRNEPFGSGNWAFSAGSAEVIIVVDEDEEDVTLEVRSTILELSGDTSELFAHVLELNAGMVGGAFAVFEGMLEIRVNRRAKGLDKVELNQLMMGIATLADYYDDELSAKFSMRREADLTEEV